MNHLIGVAVAAALVSASGQVAVTRVEFVRERVAAGGGGIPQILELGSYRLRLTAATGLSASSTGCAMRRSSRPTKTDASCSILPPIEPS